MYQNYRIYVATNNPEQAQKAEDALSNAVNRINSEAERGTEIECDWIAEDVVEYRKDRLWFRVTDGDREFMKLTECDFYEAEHYIEGFETVEEVQKQLERYPYYFQDLDGESLGNATRIEFQVQPMHEDDDDWHYQFTCDSLTILPREQ